MRHAQADFRKRENTMRVSIPVKYTVKGIEFRHRDPRQLSMFENVWVDVPDVAPSDLDLVMVVRSAAGEVLENVYGYGGKMWVRDSRGEGDLPMLPQHVAAVGRQIPNYQGSHARDNKEHTIRVIREVAGVGMLATKTGEIGDYEYRQLAYNGKDGLVLREKTPELERVRNVTESDRALKLAAAERTAWNDSIAVGGVLYRRVNEPSIVVDRSWMGNSRWMFGAINFLDAATGKQYENRSLCGVSPRDFGRLTEWFGDDYTADKLGFSMEVHDDRYMVRRTDRIALLADANRLIDAGVDRTSKTDYVLKWCQLRDAYNLLWSRDGAQLSQANVLARPDEDFERICELVEAAAASCGREHKLPGLQIWNSRTIDVPTFGVGVSGPKL
jgi:hypothetical protein